ncbi:MAG: hypothetical protein KBC48_03315 [Candidatus Pacebacteria bacterium]|nr:hypothetical protein [Candidatus Paceibacterota bacterium]
MKNLNPQSGFALLYAVLLTGIILAIGLGLSAIMAKQIILSSTGAASQKAYYAANTAKECILHWGINGKLDEETGFYRSVFGGYGVDVDNNLVYLSGEVEEITCGGNDINVGDPDEGDGEVFFDMPEFNLPFQTSEGEVNLCVKATVYVRDGEDEDNRLSQVVTTGSNLDCENSNNSRRVEREILSEGAFFLPPLGY